MAEVKLRLNLDAEEVELVVDNEVALTSGSDVFRSWVDAHNEKHKPTIVEPVAPVEPVEEKVVNPATPVDEEASKEAAQEVVEALDNAPAS